MACFDYVMRLELSSLKSPHVMVDAFATPPFLDTGLVPILLLFTLGVFKMGFPHSFKPMDHLL